jgi:phosphohistidine phosphatase SixA
MVRIEEEEFREAVGFVPVEAMGEYWKEHTISQYREQCKRDTSRGILVSGLISLTLIGGLLMADSLTPKDVKYSRQIRAEQMAREMPYGIR